MSLGTALKEDIEAAMSLKSSSYTDFGINLVTAMVNYAGSAEYADGSILVAGSWIPTDFIMVANSTANAASIKIANGIAKYWNTAVVTAGVPTQGGVAVVIFSISGGGPVYSSLQPALEIIFNNISKNPDGSWPTLSQKAQEIATAIETAVGTITTIHSETNPPAANIGPFTGGIS